MAKGISGICGRFPQIFTNFSRRTPLDPPKILAKKLQYSLEKKFKGASTHFDNGALVLDSRTSPEIIQHTLRLQQQTVEFTHATLNVPKNTYDGLCYTMSVIAEALDPKYEAKMVHSGSISRVCDHVYSRFDGLIVDFTFQQVWARALQGLNMPIPHLPLVAIGTPENMRDLIPFLRAFRHNHLDAPHRFSVVADQFLYYKRNSGLRFFYSGFTFEATDAAKLLRDFFNESHGKNLPEITEKLRKIYPNLGVRLSREHNLCSNIRHILSTDSQALEIYLPNLAKATQRFVSGPHYGYFFPFHK